MTGPPMSYRQATALVEAYNIPLAPAHFVHTVAEAAAAGDRLGFPVVLKAISPHQSHKSEAGLVHLNLETPAAVEIAAQALLAATTDLALEGLLVQSMIKGGAEMVVGLTTDPQFGPVVLLGSGGALVELLDDVVLRLPPLSQRQAVAMIQETRAWPLLQGFRNRPPADVNALTQLLVNVSRLAVEQVERVNSLDLNPVMVMPAGQGVRVVDLRIVSGP